MNNNTGNKLKSPSLLFDDISDLTDDLVFLLDPEGNFIRINRTGALNLEYQSHDLENNHFFTIIDESDYNKVNRYFSSLLDGEDRVIFDAVIKSRLGIKSSYRISMKAFRDEGKITGAGGIARSITAENRNQTKIVELEGKLLEASRLISIERARWRQDKSVLEELNKLKSEFISNISHELRTPLASIIGFSETIMSDPDMSPELRNEFNNIILTEGKRLARLINEILEISRMESGKISLLKVDVELISLLKESSELNAPYFSKKNINFTFEFPEEEVIISGDKEKLFSVFAGLINNAVKFTPAGGRIKLILHKMNKEAEIIISDTGVGIPEKDLPFIFQKFITFNKEEQDIPQSGKGLVFAKQIIDLHRGLIIVHSEENKGTTFVVKLPYHNKSEGVL